MKLWQRVLAKLREEDSPPVLSQLSDERHHIAARDMGYALLRLARGSDDADAVILKHFENVDGTDLNQVKVELICLRAFVVDFAVWATLRNETERIAVLDAFYEALAEIARHDADGAALVEHIKNRILKYSEVIKEPTDLCPAWPIGKAFAKFCGSESIHDIVPGSIEFAATLKQVSEFVKKLRIAG